jgi:ribosomal protein S18 acetylase RimI-like enzyme
MKELYVPSAARGMGIGETLTQWLAKYAHENRCARFDWTVDESNEGALRFYHQLSATHIKDKLYFRVAGGSLSILAAGDSPDA